MSAVDLINMYVGINALKTLSILPGIEYYELLLFMYLFIYYSPKSL